MDFKRLLLAAMLILSLAPCAFAKKDKAKKSKSPVQSVKSEQSQAAAQESQEGEEGEESEESGAPEQSWQILEWEDEKSRLVSRYDVLIQERNKKGVFVDLMKLETKDNSTQVKIEPALPPGFYRYSIVSYNLFNVAKAQSDWEEFTIYKAYKPRVNDASVSVNLNSNIYLDYKNDGVISFGGRNLFMPPESPDDISFSEYVLQSNNGRTIKPLEILERAENGRKITFKED